MSDKWAQDALLNAIKKLKAEYECELVTARENERAALRRDIRPVDH